MFDIKKFLNTLLCFVGLRKKQCFKYGIFTVVEYCWAWQEFSYSEENPPAELLAVDGKLFKDLDEFMAELERVAEKYADKYEAEKNDETSC